MLRGPLPRYVPNPLPRDNRVLDWTRNRKSAVAEEDDLERCWRRLAPRALRLGAETGRPERRWLPTLEGLVSLAACAPHEQAFEYSVLPGRHGGAFTHWLLHVLEHEGTSMNLPRALHSGPRAGPFFGRDAKPRIDGAADRLLFAAGSSELRPTVRVLAVAEDRLLLGTGAAHGVARGTRFALFRPGWSAGDLAGHRLGVVELTTVGGAESWATPLGAPSGELPGPGSVALPLGRGSTGPRRTVRLEPHGLASSQTHGLEQELRSRATGLFEVIPPDRSAEYTIAVDAGGLLTVHLRDGMVKSPALPPLPVSRLEARERMARLLVHLIRYRNTEELFNHDTTRPSSASYGPHFLSFPRATIPRKIPSRVSCSDAGRRLGPGEWLCLTLENGSKQPLYLAVLDLDSRFAIGQIYPSHATTSCSRRVRRSTSLSSRSPRKVSRPDAIS